jgi:signal transduction histidine kinase
VTNLVSNAVRYTPEGGSVAVRTATDGERPRLEVSDTGIGIPEDELPHIFEEFYRGRQPREIFAHGTGLGMSIVRRVVDMHGGNIRVESTVGEGTRFTVTFPPSHAPQA